MGLPRAVFPLLLLAARASNCSYEILMVDDRPFKKLSPFTAPYWVMSAALNMAFAQEHDHGFHLVRPSHGKKSAFKGWNKVWYIEELLSRQSLSQCKWILYLDADAFVRSSFSLEWIVDRLLRKYQRSDDCRSSAIFAVEHPLEFQNITAARNSLVLSGALQPKVRPPSVTWINTGVFFFRADCPASTDLFHRWLVWAALLKHKRLYVSWPGEQGIMTELLKPNSYPRALPQGSLESLGNLEEIRETVVVVNTTEINSPFGRDIQHSWGAGADDARLRDWAMADALLRIGKADPGSFLRLCREVL
ncbi:unnamed protein product, partial [Symbiodinium microadriaticum]